MNNDPFCLACSQVGMVHCSDPMYCGRPDQPVVYKPFTEAELHLPVINTDYTVVESDSITLPTPEAVIESRSAFETLFGKDLSMDRVISDTRYTSMETEWCWRGWSQGIVHQLLKEAT